MLLAIDAGNTRIKYSVFENDTVLENGSLPNEGFQTKIESLVNRYMSITDIVVVSVGIISRDDLSFVHKVNVTFILNSSNFPFKNRYKTPHTLGLDRMVLAAGAVFRYPEKNRLVVDAGTCITYDFIDADDNYLGGGISPGLRLRYEALHSHTAKLPLLETTVPVDLLGDSTEASIHSGIVNGIANEIDGFIQQYASRYPNFIIILTGGDTEFLSKRLKNTIFANSNFLLESLNQLFQYNSNK